MPGSPCGNEFHSKALATNLAGVLGRAAFPRLVSLAPEPWKSAKHIRNPLNTPDFLFVPYGKPYTNAKGTTVVLVAMFQLGAKRQAKEK